MISIRLSTQTQLLSHVCACTLPSLSHLDPWCPGNLKWSFTSKMKCIPRWSNMHKVKLNVWIWKMKNMHSCLHWPDAADTTRGESSGSDGGSLLHEASDREPETVAERVLVDQQVTATFQTGVRVVPLVRCQSGESMEGESEEENSQQEQGWELG